MILASKQAQFADYVAENLTARTLGDLARDSLMRMQPGEGMRTATWRSHVIRPGRPCLSCNSQLDLRAVGADKAGALEDPAYIAGLGEAAAPVGGQNVAVLSISAAASILAQYVSLNVAPGGIGEPGPCSTS